MRLPLHVKKALFMSSPRIYMTYVEGGTYLCYIEAYIYMVIATNGGIAQQQRSDLMTLVMCWLGRHTYLPFARQ